MKKRLLGLSLLVIGIGTTAVYAKEMPIVRSSNNYMMEEMQGKNEVIQAKSLDTAITYNDNYSEKELEEVFKSRVKFRKQELKELLDKGLITKEEYKYELDSIAETEKYHEERGYDYMDQHGRCELGSGMGIRSSSNGSTNYNGHHNGRGMHSGLGRGCH